MKIVLQQKRYTQNYFAEHTQFDFHLATWVVWTNTQFAIAGLFLCLWTPKARNSAESSSECLEVTDL